MNETRERTSISSSARDPIDRWLDVFVRLLRVPKADAQRIRDELEDHLRARVDDLMLTGHAEPDAVRRAVAELGETAELARQFQSATKPHRRLTMLAGSAIVSAGLITGAVLLAPLNAPQPTQNAPAANAAGAVDAAETTPPVFTADLVADPETGYARLGDAVKLIEQLLDSRVIAHYRAISQPGGGVGAEDEIAPLPLKGLTLEQGLEQLTIAVHLPQEEQLAVYETDNALELAPQSFFDKRDAVLIEYDVSTLLNPPDGDALDPFAFANTVESLIEPQLWGDTARLGMVSTTMIVNAHPRIHAQITDLFARIEARYAAQRDAQLREQRAKLEGQLVQFAAEIEGYNDRIAEIRSDLGRATTDRRAARERGFMLELKAEQALADQAQVDQVVAIELDRVETDDALREAEARIADLNRHLSNMESSLNITKAQLRRAERSLAELGDAGRPAPAREAAKAANAVYITGDVDRPGTYAMADGLTARRAAAMAGAEPEAIIEITRDSEPGTRVLRSAADAELKAGDLVRFR